VHERLEVTEWQIACFVLGDCNADCLTALDEKGGVDKFVVVVVSDQIY
jgi:hypothetical protein